MKTHSILSAFILFFLFLTGGLHAESVKGNGKIVTKEMDVVNFDEIILAVPAVLNFTQGDEYNCSITIDENLLPYISFKVVDDGLYIRQLPSKDGKPWVSFNFGDKEVSFTPHRFADLRFTKFVINVTAPTLEDVKVLGSGTFCMEGEFTDSKLDIDVNGSGTFKAEQPMKVVELDVDVSGSGNAHLNQVSAVDADISISGSGSIISNIVCKVLSCKIAGSGNIKVQGAADRAKAKIAGSGSIDLGKISQSLKYDIAGSGSVYYGGSAETSGIVAGSGTVQHKDDQE